MLVTNLGQLIRVPVDDISIRRRRSGGVTVFKVDEGERVVSVARLPDTGEEVTVMAMSAPAKGEWLDERANRRLLLNIISSQAIRLGRPGYLVPAMGLSMDAASQKNARKNTVSYRVPEC